MTKEQEAGIQLVRYKWIGRVKAEWIVDPTEVDRDMKLLENFGIELDAHLGGVWLANKDEVINGASIPPILWSIVGPPYVGDYRRASVIHDVYCYYYGDVPWEQGPRRTSYAVHRMFFHAMLADGTHWFQASAMYVAVAVGGPQWDKNGTPLRSKPVTQPELQRIDCTIRDMFPGRIPASSDELQKRLEERFKIAE